MQARATGSWPKNPLGFEPGEPPDAALFSRRAGRTKEAFVRLCRGRPLICPHHIRGPSPMRSSHRPGFPVSWSSKARARPGPWRRAQWTSGWAHDEGAPEPDDVHAGTGQGPSHDVRQTGSDTHSDPFRWMGGGAGSSVWTEVRQRSDHSQSLSHNRMFCALRLARTSHLVKTERSTLHRSHTARRIGKPAARSRLLRTADQRFFAEGIHVVACMYRHRARRRPPA